MTELITSPNKWDSYFFNTAFAASRMSKDPSTKVGAVLVKDRQTIAMSYNGFPSGFPDDPDLLNDREQKLKLTEHAERNALNQVARYGGNVAGSTIYVTHCPCMDCAKGLINSGIKEVKYLSYPKFEQRWNFSETKKVFDACGVKVVPFSPEDMIVSIKDKFNIDILFEEKETSNFRKAIVSFKDPYFIWDRTLDYIKNTLGIKWEYLGRSMGDGIVLYNCSNIPVDHKKYDLYVTWVDNITLPYGCIKNEEWNG